MVDKMHQSTHNCGEIGGLGQNRSRYLLIARQPDKIPNFIYKSFKYRVKAIGEILGRLPMPNDPTAWAHAYPAEMHMAYMAAAWDDPRG